MIDIRRRHKEGCLDIADSPFLTKNDTLVENYKGDSLDELAPVNTIIIVISIIVVAIVIGQSRKKIIRI